MMFEINPFTGEFVQGKPENKNFGPFTHFDCGLLADLDFNPFHKIDCDDLPICCSKRKIDLGALDECGD